MAPVVEAELHPRLAERLAEEVLVELAGSLMVVNQRLSVVTRLLVSGRVSPLAAATRRIAAMSLV
jgi:hypothetical protein